MSSKIEYVKMYRRVEFYTSRFHTTANKHPWFIVHCKSSTTAKFLKEVWEKTSSKSDMLTAKIIKLAAPITEVKSMLVKTTFIYKDEIIKVTYVTRNRLHAVELGRCWCRKSERVCDIEENKAYWRFKESISRL